MYCFSYETSIDSSMRSLIKSTIASSDLTPGPIWIESKFIPFFHVWVNTNSYDLPIDTDSSTARDYTRLTLDLDTGIVDQGTNQYEERIVVCQLLKRW